MLPDNEDVESNFSEQFEKDDHTAFILAESTDFETDEISVISTIQEVNHVQSKSTGPSVKVSIIPSKFHKPVLVIGFLDTSAQHSMLNPHTLPPDYWENHTEYFRAANGKVFETSLITKKPIDVLRLYTLSDIARPYTSISQKFLELCPENHSQFTHPSPLWKNEQFFIHLPFKLNEDVNPTKATHPGMPPTNLSLAKQECTQLLRQDLIEPTTSDWACQAFYVEKRSELVHGKKRLVIDYQPLNAFLKDDKFPLPKIQSLFIHLQGAKVFSKFDLKAGFWQLGISPEDRPKTAFCIPDAHYQWTLDRIPDQEADMFTSVFIVHKPHFQHPETKDYWTQDMAYEWKTFPHPFPLNHDPTIISMLKAYLLELNNVQPVLTNIHHTSIGPSHILEIIPRTQTCTPESSSSPHGILVREQRPDYTNVLFQDAQDPWEDFQSLLPTQDTQYTITEPSSSSTPAPPKRNNSPELDEDYLIYQEIQKAKEDYENETGDVSPSRFPSTLTLLST
ncbi:hypothetical protein KPL71_012005 [Citrus sinensis]|uniref:Uncharacterized protein n=1 Tax=Citrus sinensis TaxID=2711 RepID=A0ACB8L8A5_CITSI|nr:hypothetical protein KPL71_012005 [Citrus sinensis]